MLFYRSDVADRPPAGSGNNNYEFASLWMLDHSTGLIAEIIAQGANGWTAQGVADWSPDGTRIVMAAESTPDGGRWHVFVTDDQGQSATRVSTRTSLYLDPSWSPDGTEIAFETDIDPTFNGVGRWGLRSVTSDGATLRMIIEDSQINTLPQWSHNGEVIYFHHFVFGAPEAFRIARINSDGMGLAYLTSGGSYDDSDYAHTNFQYLRSGGIVTEADWFDFEFPTALSADESYQQPVYFSGTGGGLAPGQTALGHDAR